MKTTRRRHKETASAAAAVGSSAAALLRAPEHTTHPVLRVLLERARAASRPGARDDGHLVCLAVEGGGLRGAVTSGMCVVLEAAGLVPSFDRIYGVSAGALNGGATAAGQAALSATHYQDAVRRGVIDRKRPLRGRPVIDYDLLFEVLIGARKPLSFEGLAHGPEFRAIATSLETLSRRVLADFADADELLQAVRASGSLPRLCGTPPMFRGERMVDGGLVEPIPYETALADGATHVLVLRSRPAGYQQPSLQAVCDSLALRDRPELAEALKKGQGIYRRQAAELSSGRHGARLFQVAVPDGTRLVGRLESNGARVTEALRLGAGAMASAILTDSVDLCWQPVVYRAAPLEAGVAG